MYKVYKVYKVHKGYNECKVYNVYKKLLLCAPKPPIQFQLALSVVRPEADSKCVWVWLEAGWVTMHHASCINALCIMHHASCIMHQCINASMHHAPCCMHHA